MAAQRDKVSVTTLKAWNLCRQLLWRPIGHCVDFSELALAA